MAKTGRSSGAYRGRNSDLLDRPGVHDILERERRDSDGPPPSNRSVLGNVHQPGMVPAIGIPESADELDVAFQSRPTGRTSISHRIDMMNGKTS